MPALLTRAPNRLAPDLSTPQLRHRKDAGDARLMTRQPRPLLRPFYLAAGLVAMALGIIGIPVPLLPTVPFFILAAFFFARSSPRLEARLLDHPSYGLHIRRWRERGAISRKAKQAATIAFAFSIVLSLWLAPWPWPAVTIAAALASGTWIWRRPEA